MTTDTETDEPTVSPYVTGLTEWFVKTHRITGDLDRFMGWLDGHADAWAAAELEPPYLAFQSRGFRMEGMTLQVMCSDAARLTAAARLLADGAPIGAVQKTYDDHKVAVSRRWGTLSVEAWASRENACERVQTGTKLVRTRPVTSFEECEPFEVAEYEWKCPPLLPEASR